MCRYLESKYGVEEASALAQTVPLALDQVTTVRFEFFWVLGELGYSSKQNPKLNKIYHFFEYEIRY
jgi:hypothetical protein